MALTSGTPNFPNQVFVPEFWSSNILGKYYAENMLPQITNQNFKEIISAKGDTVHIMREPTWNVYDHQVDADLNWQNIDDTETTLTIDYDKVSSVVIPDEWKLMSAVDLKSVVTSGFAKAHAQTIMQIVTVGAYSAATSTATTATWKTAGNASIQLSEAAARLSSLNIPMENRWLLLHPMALAKLNLEVSNYAQNAGNPKGALITGYVGEYAGFSVYQSSLVPGAGTSGSPYLCMAGHKDAISVASTIKNLKVKDLSNKLGEGIVGQTLFGFKVTQPDALCKVPVDITT